MRLSSYKAHILVAIVPEIQCVGPKLLKYRFLPNDLNCILPAGKVVKSLFNFRPHALSNEVRMYIALTLCE